jgi:hypothetical protein
MVLVAGSLAHARPVKPALEEKSPTVAVTISISVPVAGALTLAFAPGDGAKAVGVVAMFFGPSMGQWYANKPGGLGLGLRAISLVTVLGALVLVVNEECEIDTRCPTTTNDITAASSPSAPRDCGSALRSTTSCSRSGPPIAGITT